MTDYITPNDITKKYEKILKPNIFRLIKKIEAKSDELNENKYWLTIYFSDYDSKNKILVILINLKSWNINTIISRILTL